MKMAEHVAGFTGIKAFNEALRFAREVKVVSPESEFVLVHMGIEWHVVLIHPGSAAH